MTLLLKQRLDFFRCSSGAHFPVHFNAEGADFCRLSPSGEANGSGMLGKSALLAR